MACFPCWGAGAFTSVSLLSSYHLCYCSGSSSPKLVSFYSKSIVAKGRRGVQTLSDIPALHHLVPSQRGFVLPPLLSTILTSTHQSPHSLQTTTLLLSLDLSMPFPVSPNPSFNSPLRRSASEECYWRAGRESRIPFPISFL